MERVSDEGGFFITLDVDFADIRRYSLGSHPGMSYAGADRRARFRKLGVLCRDDDQALRHSRDSSVQGPLKILAEADKVALLYNWPKAATHYAEAETLFAQSGDGKNALVARLGYIWSTTDAGVSRAVNQESPVI